MEASLLRTTDDLEATGASLVALTVPVTPVPIDRVASPDGAPLMRWDSPAPDRDGRVWCFAGSGEAARVEGSGEARFDEIRGRADELFASLVERRHPEASFAPPPRLHGGIAFRPEPARSAPWSAFRDASFVLPRWLYGTSGDRAFVRVVLRAGERASAAQIRASVTLRRDLREVAAVHAQQMDRTSPEIWGAMIGDALSRIRAGELSKVVPTTLCKVAAGAALDPRAALERLGALYPDCVRFAFPRGDAIFLGASPERLVDKRGLAVESDALAGSASRRADGDARAAAALLESDKDRREHEAVVAAVRAAIEPLAQRIKVPGAPVVRTLRNVHHLWTPISATLARPLHVLDLVRALHPTPAVCGTPRDAAIRWIATHEPDTRGWYAGAVGWFDAEGDGAFSVAIRSGVLSPREAWLYAGAGIVEGSDSSLEYAETRVKYAPMLAALGLKE